MSGPVLAAVPPAAVSGGMAPEKGRGGPPSRLIRALGCAVVSSALMPCREGLSGARDASKLEKRVGVINAV
eukprot:4521956-Pyramimonas_sp.AAC.1